VLTTEKKKIKSFLIMIFVEHRIRSVKDISELLKKDSLTQSQKNMNEQFDNLRISQIPN